MSNCYDKKGQPTNGCYVGVTGGDECGMNSKMRFGCPKGGVPQFMAPQPGAGPTPGKAGVENFSLTGTVRPSCYFPGGPGSDVGVGV